MWQIVRRITNQILGVEGLMQPLPTPLSPSAWFTHKLPEVINISIQQTGNENIPTYQEEAAILI